MATIEQVISQIRFQLDQLSARNAHHEFEHLCRHLARLRICSNILPATGPISSGGDQGRDFETFQTYLKCSPISNSAFAGLISDGPIAFACTLQKKGIKGKIESDVSNIMASGSPVCSVHYFCSTDIPVSSRHTLQSWTIDNHSISLEIYDGQGIAELLSDREIFWIAERYLSIPGEIFPPASSDNSDDWYHEIITSWKNEERQPVNYADFCDIKLAARHALHADALKHNLFFWIKLLDNFKNLPIPNNLRRKIIYEICVLSIRSLGNMFSHENDLHEYFKEIPNLNNPFDLRDASTLYNYCFGAIHLNCVQVSADELLTWRNSLLKKVDDELNATDNTSAQCILLETKGYLYATIRESEADSVNFDKTIKYWLEMADKVELAPLFPLDEFADALTKFLEINIIYDHPEYDRLSQRIDTLLSERYGGFIAAEKCRDRAIALHGKKLTLRAITQLHHAKINWFAEETLRGSILSSLLISQWYEELGLLFAAKYYSLSAAYVCTASNDLSINSFLPRALVYAAETDYHRGAWFSYLELADVALKAYYMLCKESDPTDASNEINRTLFHLTIICVTASQIAPELLGILKERIDALNLGEIFDELYAIAYKEWNGKSISEIWKSLEEQLLGRPFSDIGPFRNESWQALGISWNFEWSNDYETNMLAEEFLAFFQIFLSDISATDLCLLKTSVNSHIQLSEIPRLKIDSTPSNEYREWEIEIPRSQFKTNKSLDEIISDYLPICVILLDENSLLPFRQLQKIIEDRFKEGLLSKVFFGCAFSKVYGESLNKETYEKSIRTGFSKPEPHRPFNPIFNNSIPWFGGPGPGYSHKNAQEHIKNRYDRSIIPIKYTLRRLIKDESFQNTLQKLRNEGWLDWHILVSIMQAVVNYRVALRLKPNDEDNEHKKLLVQIMNEPEKESDDIIPMSEFREDKLRMNLKLSMLSYIKILDLELRQVTPDLNAIDHFLKERYNYWTDDIDHQNFFA